MPGEGPEMERTPGTLFSPPCSGHSSGPGGREPPPSMLSQVLNVCHVAGIERETSGHGDVHHGCV